MPTASTQLNTEHLACEEWRAVVGYEDLYEVSSAGRVRSFDRIIEQNSRWGHQSRRKAGRVLSLHTNRLGYRRIKLCRMGEQKTFTVASLVAAAFIGPRPEGYHICHNDGAPGNNAVGNLRYDTVAGNCADKVRHGTLRRGSAASLAGTTEEQARAVRAQGKFATWERLAEHHGLSVSIVRGIILERTWRHI